MVIQPLPEHLGAPRQIGDSVELLRRRYGLAEPGTVEAVRDGWTTLVGEVLAARSEVIDLRDGTLRVRVDDSAVAQRLQWDQARITAGVAPEGVVRTLSIRVSPKRSGS